jgi:hypothetical protein
MGLVIDYDTKERSWQTEKNRAGSYSAVIEKEREFVVVIRHKGAPM